MDNNLGSEIVHRLQAEEKHFLQKHRSVIAAANGVIEDDFFIIKPGCLMVARTETTSSAISLFEGLNLDVNSSTTDQLVEFCARITYLSFPQQPRNSKIFHEKMTRELQHLSVWGGVFVSFLLAGIALETSLELLAHSEAKVCRLTSSKTKAMNMPLFRLQGSDGERLVQKNYLLQLILDRLSLEKQTNCRSISENSNEFFNILAPGAKATSLVYTMSLKDFHKLFIGRLSEKGNESEVQEICSMMCEQLHHSYPMVIRSVSDYYAMNNGAKYVKSSC